MPCGQFHEQIGLNEKEQGMCSSHVFTNLEFLLLFFREKVLFFAMLSWHLITYLIVK